MPTTVLPATPDFQTLRRAWKLMVAPDLKTYLTYLIEFWRLIKSKEKLIPQYDNCMPRHLYEIFADRPRNPKNVFYVVA